MDDSGSCGSAGLVATDGHTASAVLATPGFAQTSCGYLGTSDGWTDLRSDYALDGHYSSAPTGNVVETATTEGGRRRAAARDGGRGLREHRGGGHHRRPGLAGRRLPRRHVRLRGRLALLSGLAQGSAGSLASADQRRTYDVSLMVLAAPRTRPTAAPSSPHRRCLGSGAAGWRTRPGPITWSGPRPLRDGHVAAGGR